MFQHGVLSCTDQKVERLPPFFFFSLRDMTDTTIRKNTKAIITYLAKKGGGRGQAFRSFAHIYIHEVQIRG